VNITSKVIITTAYEDYALPAFRTKCIDYLLKPISESEFKVSMERCIGFCYAEEALESAKEAHGPDYRTKFTIKVGNQILIADVNDTAFFYSENKATYLVTTERKQYFLDSSLESIEQQLNPNEFFRLSRSCITSFAAISNISKHFNSRLRVTLLPDVIEPVLVSRARVPLLMEWLDR
jgi:DNA-binding LytR/AlgR family response regulator